MLKTHLHKHVYMGTPPRGPDSGQVSVSLKSISYESDTVLVSWNPIVNKTMTALEVKAVTKTLS